MNLAYLALKEYEPGLNRFEYRETDIFKIFKRDQIFYDEKPLDVHGYYEVDEQKRESIVINSNLLGTERLRTLCHECVHHYLDYPIDDQLVKIYRSLEVLQTRQDTNAEMLSLVMIFPFTTLEKYLTTGYLPSHLEPYLHERLWILNFHKI